MSPLPFGRRHRTRDEVRGRFGPVTLVPLVVAVVASLLGGATQASAAATAAAEPHPSKSSAPARPTAPAPKNPLATAEPQRPEAQRAAAAREIDALTRNSRAADTCSGAIEPNTVHACSAIPADGTAFTLDLAEAPDLLFVQAVSAAGHSLNTTLTAPDGTAVACERTDGSYGQLRCPTGRTGAHTLRVTDFWGGGGAFTVSYTALLTDAACTAVAEGDTTLGAPRQLTASLDSGAAGHCYALPSAAGEVLRTHLSTYRVTATVHDATGTEVCSTRTRGSPDLDCALTGTAPFRLLVSQSYGTTEDYTLTAARLSRPVGCPVVQPQAFGAVPDAGSATRCRTLHVPAAGPYLYGTVGTDVSGGLFRADGTPVCAPELTKPCDLAAGDYTWARNGQSTGTEPYGLWFHATDTTQGCTAVRDDGFASGPATGVFTGAGQALCLSLPTASGRGVYLVDRGDSEDTHPTVKVFDAEGAQQCVNAYASEACRLTGTAPFHAVVSGPDSGTYRLAVQRTGEAAGCTPWTQSAYGGTPGAEVRTAPPAQRVACLSLAAGAHSTAEMLDYTNDTNRVNASVQVHDSAGNKVCGTGASSTFTCRFTSGVPYTALLVSTAYGPDVYQLVRRDISATAACAAPKSLAVGGPSTGYTLTSSLDSTCLRVTAAATDRLWLSVRTPGAAWRTGAILGVADAQGTLLCRTFGSAGTCRVTGSASYTVFVLASGYQDTPITARLDTWRIGTAAGWAPQCTANTLSPEGFALRSGTFTESATAYCAVLPMKPDQAFDVYGTDSAAGSETPSVTLLAANAFGATVDYSYSCTAAGSGEFRFSCRAGANAPSGPYVLVVGPGDAPAPLEYSFQGVCPRDCATRPETGDVSRLSSTTGPAGTSNQVVLYGTGLTLGTQIELRNNEARSEYRMHVPVSVSPDGTSLTVRLGTYDLPPGTYDLVVGSVGYTSGTRSPGYLPGAYTVTAPAGATPGRLVPVSPTRFLDTRDGTGAPEARVGAGGTVRLKVAGAHGIPATGVTAVVMNVTAVSPTNNGFITVHPDGQPLPSVSNLNYTAGRTLSNLVTVAVRNGTVNLRNSAGTVDLVADVAGYYTTEEGAGSALTTIAPTRFLDTRSGTGAPKARVGAGGTVRLKVAGAHGIPATGVTAVVMNVTAVNPTNNGFITVHPDGQPLPSVSNLNYTTGKTLPNLVVVPVVNGTVNLRNSAGTVDLLADVTGYFSATGSSFVSTEPARLLDTRAGLGARAGAVGPDGVVSIQVGGAHGIPREGVTAVVLNVTVTAPTGNSFLTVHPHGQPLPGVSNLNYATGETISNLVVVPVVDGRASFVNRSGSAHVIADLNGYYGG